MCAALTDYVYCILWDEQHYIVFDEPWIMPVWCKLTWGRACELLLDDEVGDIPTDSPMPDMEGARATLIYSFIHLFISWLVGFLG